MLMEGGAGIPCCISGVSWSWGNASWGACMYEDGPKPLFWFGNKKLPCWPISGSCCGSIRGDMAGLWDGLLAPA
jgi:hypothetical protein